MPSTLATETILEVKKLAREYTEKTFIAPGVSEYLTIENAMLGAAIHVLKVLERLKL
jgi:hypothetical protein